ncbi:MAG: hypothetical protein ACHQF2_07215 [Flavobacteriales bacterium]
MRKIYFIAAVLLIGCKKFPEGGNTLFITPKVTGEYTLERELIWGVDSTAQMRTLCNNNVIITHVPDKGHEIVAGSLKGDFIIHHSEKNTIFFSLKGFDANTPFSTIFRVPYVRLDIVKFKRGDFWLRKPNGSLYIELKCKKPDA